MCGIAGIINLNNSSVDESRLKKMTDAIIHRGPESEGFWIHQNIGFGHRRLAIIDLSVSGHQPMHYLNRYTITFNGEIYNYIEIQKTLKAKGYAFVSQSDTEVIMAAYDHWGVNCLSQFDGMFAFALYDRQKDELFCARDRFGEKPFHYYLDDKQLLFSSEMKSLWAAGIQKQVDDYSVYLYLNMGLHEDPEDKRRTFYKNVFRLMPGHFFVYKQEKTIVQNKYWGINSSDINKDITFDEACNKFSELFYTSVKHRLRSDVPVGTSLSGGLDSSAVALTMYDLNKGQYNQKCFSARFHNTALDEGYFMQKVVENRNIEHHVTYPDAQSLLNEIDSIIYHQEEPFASASIFAQWEVFKLARQNNVTVLLDGQGADEILAGYTHFFNSFFRETYLKQGTSSLNNSIQEYRLNNSVDIPIHVNLIFKAEAKYPGCFRKLRSLKTAVLGVGKTYGIHNELFSAYKHKSSPFKVFTDLNSELAFFTTISGLDKLLRFADRNSMAHSREVRLPFLNHNLVEFAFSLPAEYKIHKGWTKAPIRFGLKTILPEEIAWRRNKLGFQPPQKDWEKEPGIIKIMQDFHQIAVDCKYIDPTSKPTWNSFITGKFISLIK